MYFNVIWEMVNSIYAGCTCIFIPNLRFTRFLLMYSDVLRLTIILFFNQNTCEKLVPKVITLDQLLRLLLLAGRKTLA
jgi:hypothetical protein